MQLPKLGVDEEELKKQMRLEILQLIREEVHPIREELLELNRQLSSDMVELATKLSELEERLMKYEESADIKVQSIDQEMKDLAYALFSAQKGDEANRKMLVRATLSLRGSFEKQLEQLKEEFKQGQVNRVTLNELHDTAAKLHDNIHESMASVSSILKNNIKSHYAELSKKIAELDKAMQPLQSKATLTASDIARLGKAMDGIKAHIHSLEKAEEKEKHTSLNQLKLVQASMQAKFTKLGKQVGQHQAKLTEAKSAVSSLTNYAHALGERLDNTSKSYCSLRELVKHIKSASEDIGGRMERTGRISASDFKAVNKKLAVLGAELKRVEAQITAVQSSKKAYAQSIKILTALISDYEAGKKRNKELNEQLAHIRSNMTGFNKAVSKLSGALATELKSLSKKVTALDKKAKSNKANSKDIHLVVDQIKAVAKELNELS